LRWEDDNKIDVEEMEYEVMETLSGKGKMVYFYEQSDRPFVQ
jgi:hypothetical protein